MQSHFDWIILLSHRFGVKAFGMENGWVNREGPRICGISSAIAPYLRSSLALRMNAHLRGQSESRAVEGVSSFC